MFGLSLGYQIIFDDLDSLPTDAGGDDWHQEGSRSVLHTKGNENT